MKGKRSRRRRGIAAVDLFCGAAGLSYGLKKAGISVRAGVDFDAACRWPFEKNTKSKFIHADVAKLDPKALQKYFGNAPYRLLAGCAPCQRFSLYTQKTGRRDRNRWRLLASFTELAIEIRPDVVTMENVPSLSKHRRFHEFVVSLEGAGYHVWHGIVDCHSYGVPQTRHRLVLLASLLGPIELMQPSELRIRRKNVRDAIGDLRAIDEGKVDKLDKLHRASSLSPLNQQRIRASKPGGTWKAWPRKLVLPCHERDSGKGYSAVYGRMEWDKPSPTITTLAYNYGSGRFGHPEQNRAISLREAAILQSFPKRYRFADTRDTFDIRTIGRLIGNAVPVALAEAIGRSIVAHIDRHHSSNCRRRAKGAPNVGRKYERRRRAH